MANIRKYKNGDVIVRIEPAKTKCTGYIGEGLILRGILNGSIYLERFDEEKMGYFNDHSRKVDLPLYSYKNGWERWVDPSMLFSVEINEKKKRCWEKEEEVINEEKEEEVINE